MKITENSTRDDFSEQGFLESYYENEALANKKNSCYTG
jgi:hypothetical protein